MFSFCFFISKIRFSGSGAPGVLLGGPRVGPQSPLEGENVNISLYLEQKYVPGG